VRRYLLIGLLCLPLGLWARVVPSPAEHCAQYEQVKSYTVLVFEDLTEASLTYEGSADFLRWEKFNHDFVASGTGAETIYPEANTGYLLYVKGSEGQDSLAERICVVDYSECRPRLDSLVVDTLSNCKTTHLILYGTYPSLAWTDTLGHAHAMERHFSIAYLTLDSAQWKEGMLTVVETKYESEQLTMHYEVPAPYVDTRFTFYGDEWAAQVGSQRDSVSSAEYTAIAVGAYPITITTTRGDQTENEVERPIQNTVLTGSAPLDILFKANANVPTAAYYKWEIRRGSELIASRSDMDQRYVFDDYGTYNVSLVVSGTRCMSDTISLTVTVRESMLLVPNVFTPNGDGVNDEFRVSYRSIIAFSCSVYNRWGHKVYSWNDPAKGWDGMIGGRPASEGAYFYVIQAQGADGAVYKLGGDINLLRGKK